MKLTLAYFTHVLTDEERNLVPRGPLGRFRLCPNALMLGGLIFFSDLPAWWTVVYTGVAARR